MSGVMDIVDSASDVLEGMQDALEKVTASPFESVSIFRGTREDKFFDYAESLPSPSATIIYKGSSIKQGAPARTLDVSVIVATDPGDDQTSVWELVEAAHAALDNTRPTTGGDAACFSKGDRPLDYGGASACAEVNFEIKCY